MDCFSTLPDTHSTFYNFPHSQPFIQTLFSLYFLSNKKLNCTALSHCYRLQIQFKNNKAILNYFMNSSYNYNHTRDCVLFVYTQTNVTTVLEVLAPKV